MAVQVQVIIILVFVFLFPSLTISGYLPSHIKSWCSQTPHPQPCEYFLTQNSKYGPINQKPDFLKASLNLALDRAMQDNVNMHILGPKCRNELEKAAWADCLELYEYAISRINQTIDPNTKCSRADAQTWLSSALTNLETCRDGFIDLGAIEYIFPLMNNNLPMLISNALAINNLGWSDGESSYYKGRFPTWVPPGDRKLLQTPSPSSIANVVVAQDGSGDYKTVKEAIFAASKLSRSGRYVIQVKAGTYEENIEIKLKNIMLVGDGIGKTIITGSKSAGGGSTTFKSATVGVMGDIFIGRGITFRNTAGPQNQQAVALLSSSDLSVFHQCSFEGHQDTLYVHSQRQFYRDCDIYGTLDFIFGNAAVVFQNCNIYVRNPHNKINTLTAQGRTDPNQNTGISIHNCRVTAGSDLKPFESSVRTYLGRPWKKYSRTIFMKTNLDSLIEAVGWIPWSGNLYLNTLYYGEYMNTGPGSSTLKRVKWGGYHVITKATEADKFSVGNFIGGGSWLPTTNVPFTLGL